MRTQRSSPTIGVHQILIIEPIEWARVGLTSIILAVSRFAVCAATGNFEEAFELVDRHRPDLVIADLFHHSRDGIFWTKDFVTRFPKRKLFVASWNTEEAFAERVLRAGARGYWVKGGSAESLVGAIDAVLAGELSVSPSLALLAVHKLVEPNHSGAPAVDHLSDRELSVFTLIATGHGVGQMVRELGISRKTVETHCEHIKLKLGYQGATALKRGAHGMFGSQGNAAPIPDSSIRDHLCQKSGTIPDIPALKALRILADTEAGYHPPKSFLRAEYLVAQTSRSACSKPQITHPTS